MRGLLIRNLLTLFENMTFPRKLITCIENKIISFENMSVSNKVNYLLLIKNMITQRRIIISFENITKVDGTLEPGTFGGSPVRPRTQEGHGPSICIDMNIYIYIYI